MGRKEPGMKKFFRGLLKLPVTFYKTLIDFKYYKVLDKLPVSHAIGYIVVLSLLFSFIAVIPSAIDVSRSSKEFYRQYNEYAPDFQIVDGIMTTGTGSPVFMIDQPGKALVVVFDETDSVTPSSLDEYQSVLLIDSDSIYIKSPLTEQDMQYSTIFPADIDKEGFTAYLGLVNIVKHTVPGFLCNCLHTFKPCRSFLYFLLREPPLIIQAHQTQFRKGLRTGMLCLNPTHSD